MVGRLLIRGMLAGLFAGLLVFGFARLVGEPELERAIAIEARLDAAQAKAETAELASAEMARHTPDSQPVSRAVQSGIGLFTGVVVYCTAFGGVFALAFAFANGRVPGVSPRALSLLLGVSAFLALSLLPGLKYPANPPSIGEAETIGVRTALYFLLMAISFGAALGAAAVRASMLHRFGAWNATLIAGAAYLLAMVAAQLALPAIDEVPEAFPAALLWSFRIASLGMQAVMWGTLGVVFGILVEGFGAGSPRAVPFRPNPPAGV